MAELESLASDVADLADGVKLACGALAGLLAAMPGSFSQRCPGGNRDLRAELVKALEAAGRRAEDIEARLGGGLNLRPPGRHDHGGL